MSIHQIYGELCTTRNSYRALGDAEAVEAIEDALEALRRHPLIKDRLDADMAILAEDA